MTAPSQRRQRKVSWDVLRVLCLLMVITYHATFMAPMLEPVLQPRALVFPVQVGASSLLMISAFFTAQSLSRGRPLSFWYNRLARLLPPFVVAVLFTWSVMHLAAPYDWWRPTLRELAGNLLMLWSVHPEDVPYIDGSYWTLPVQLLAFSVAAALVAQGWQHGRRLRVLLWGAVLVPIAQWPFRISEPPEVYRALVDTLGFHRIHLFVLGVAVWLWSTRRIGHLHAVALGGVCLVAHAMHTMGDVWAVTGLGVVAILACLAARGPDWGRWLPGPVREGVYWLASISYGVYLLHQTLGYLVMRWVNNLGGGQVLEVASMGVVSVLLGWLLTRLVERPVSGVVSTWTRRAAAARKTVGTHA